MFFKIKKTVVLCFTVALSNMNLYAQQQTKDDSGEYSHSIGISYLAFNQYSKEWSMFQNNVGLMYNFRVDHKLGNHSSIGVSMFPSIGTTFSTNLKMKDFTPRLETLINGLPFCYEIPMLIQFNLGNHSTSITRYKYGKFFGAGFCYSYYPGTNIKLDPLKNITISPSTHLSFCASAGFKIRVKKMSYGIRVFYSKPFDLRLNEKGSNFGISLMYNLGKHFKF